LNDRESRIRAKEAGADDVLVKPIDGLELLVRIDCLLRARAHFMQLARERDRLREELSHARAALGTEQRGLRIDAATEQLRSLLDRQRARLENAKKRWGSNAEAREEMQRFAQIAAELSQTVELLASAATGTASSDATGTHALESEVRLPASAIK
jgi:response regulator RpfG family c-di-GMP phosphodiesterase